MTCMYMLGHVCEGLGERDSHSQCTGKPSIGFFWGKNEIIKFALRYYSSHLEFSVAFGTLAFPIPYNIFVP